VNVVLTLGINRSATVVPSPAVQIGQDQTYVYVVKPDLTAELRKVKTGDVIGDLTVVEEGLRPGEQVVTDGQLRLVARAKVQAKGPQKEGGSEGASEREKR